MSFSPSFAVPPATPPAPGTLALASSSTPSSAAGPQQAVADSTAVEGSDLHGPLVGSSGGGGGPKHPSSLALSMAAVSPPTPAPSPRPSEAVGLSHSTFFGTIEGQSAEDSQTSHLLSIFSQLPPAARTNLLQSLLPLLTTPELLLLSSGISPRLKRDFLRDLPLEIALHILSFVDSPRTLARASCVSKFWRRLLEDEWTWKEMCARHRFAAAAIVSTPASGGASPAASIPELPPMLQEGDVSEMDEGDEERSPDLTMFGSPRASIQAPGAPRMPVGGMSSIAAFPLPFIPQTPLGDLPPTGPASAEPPASAPPPANAAARASYSGPSTTTDEPPAVDAGSLSTGASPSSLSHLLPSTAHVTFSSLPDFFRSPTSGSGTSAAAVAVREALEAPSPASFLAYALSSVHAPAGITSQFPFATADEDDSVMSDEEATGPSVAASSPSPSAAGGEHAHEQAGMPILSPSSFLASLTNTLGLPYGTPTPSAMAASAGLSTAAEPDSPSAPQPQHAGPSSRPHFLPRGSGLGLAPFPARAASLGGARSASSPLAGVGGSGSKGKGKVRRRNSAGGEVGEEGGEEARFSYKRHFKRAYLTESNWLRGGRLLSTHTSTDDGVVTSLAVDDRYIVIGMANCKIHVFDAGTGTFLRTLVGHELGVWCLTLISAGGERKEPPPPREAKDGDVDMDGGASTYGAFGRPSARQHHRRGSGNAAAVTGSGSSAARDPVLVGGTDSPSTTAPPHGLFGGLGDFSSAGNAAGDSRSSTSLPPSFDNHFTASERRRTDRPPRVAQSDVCGASKGFGQSRTLIVSGGCDRDVRVWDAETGACLYILRGHTSTIRCLKVLEGRPLVVSGSRDATLRVWDVEKGVLVHLLAGHQHSVRCIEVAGNQVVSGSYDCTCRLWDVDTGECLHVFRGHYHQIYSVAFDGERVATGSLDSTVRVWSAETGDCLALLQGHTSLVGQLQLTNDLLVTGGSDGRVIVFSLSTFECLHRLCAHDNSVTCLQFDDRFIVSGGNDGRVKLWDLRTGAFIRELSKPCEAVWRVSFKDDKCVVLCKRAGKTVMEVLTFRPSEEDL